MLGFDKGEQEEPTKILKAIMEEWVQHFKEGNFRRVKQIAVSEKYLREEKKEGRPLFEWKIPSKLFKATRYFIKA